MTTNAANGSTRQWRALRDWQLRHFPTCQHEGCTRPATDAHHIMHLARGGKRFDKANLRSLCDDHHKLIHRREGKGTQKPRIEIDPKTGLPLPGQEHWWNDR